MKGIVFEMFESFVTSIYDEEVWEHIMMECSMEDRGPFYPEEQYQQQDFCKLADEMVQVSKLPLPTLLRSFGEYSFSFLDEQEHWPLENGSNPAVFVSWINASICDQEHKLALDTYIPHLKEDQIKEEHVDEFYTADKKLCYLYDGIFMGCTKIPS